MAVHKTSRSGLFLLELMIVILFFAVTSAVCVNLFVQAHLTSTAGGELTAATGRFSLRRNGLRRQMAIWKSWRPSWMQKPRMADWICISTSAGTAPARRMRFTP